MRKLYNRIVEPEPQIEEKDEDLCFKDLKTFQNTSGVFKVVKCTKFGINAKLINLIGTENSLRDSNEYFYSISNLDLIKGDYFVGIIKFKPGDPQPYVQATTEDILLKKCKVCDTGYNNISERFPFKFTCVKCGYDKDTYSNFKKPQWYKNFLLLY